jgi:hypothetical protein
MFEMPSDQGVKELKITRAYAEEKLGKANVSRLNVA